MSKYESNMQRLHQLAVKGEILNPEEQTALQSWYDKLDQEEDLILNNSQPLPNVIELRENLAKTNKQVAKVTREIGNLIKHNETLQKENNALKIALESRLTEKVA